MGPELRDRTASQAGVLIEPRTDPVPGPVPADLWKDLPSIPRITVDLFQFITRGTFDCVTPGDRMEWILHNFPQPDCVDPMPGGKSIWEYGDFEFHFAGDLLMAIYCEDFRAISAGKNIALKKWFFNKSVRHSLRKVLTILTRHKINYVVLHDSGTESIRVRVLASRVDLFFEVADPGKTYGDADDAGFELVGFGMLPVLSRTSGDQGWRHS